MNIFRSLWDNMKNFLKEHFVYLLIFAFTLLVATLISTPIHELGHAIICFIYGDGVKDISFLVNPGVNCSKELSGYPDEIQNFFGGTFSAIILFVLYFILKKFIKYKHFLTQIFLPIIAMQLLNAVLEGGFNKFYKSIAGNVIFLFFFFIIVFLLILVYQHKDLEYDAKEMKELFKRIK